MKLADVTRQLQLLIPKYTGMLGTALDISDIVATTSVATISTSKVHDLKDNEAIVLANVGTNTAISAVSQDGLVFTFTTDTEHDLTLDSPDHENATLVGFTDSAWNGSFRIVDVPNRYTFKVQSTNTLPVLNGNEYIREIRSDGINGRHRVTVINPTTFTISGTFLASSYSGGTVNAKIRIAGSVTFERAMEQYTEQALSDIWMFVVMADARVSKDRNVKNDSDASLTTGIEMRQRVIDGFEIFIFINTTEDIAATDGIDIARHDLMLPILKAVYGAYFDSGLSGDSDFRTIFTSHGFVDYNKAILAYSYQFQTLYDITDDDTVEPLDTRAYRDVDGVQTIGGADTEAMTLVIDIDDQPV